MSNAFLSAFNWYGFLIAMGIVLGVVGCYFAAKHRGLEGDVVIDMIIICLPLAIIGSRCYHVFFDVLAGNSWTFKKFIGLEDGGLAGLAIYGGLFGSIAGAGLFRLWKNRKSLPENKRVSFWQIMDLGFTFMILGQAIGRWGNYANGEDYGAIINNPAWQWFPFGLFIEKDQSWHYALFFYESLWNAIGFGILLYIYLGRFKSFDGFNFACYGIYYGVGRSFLEAIRDDGDVLMLGSARVSLLVSIMFILAGVAIIVTHIVRAKKAGKKIFIFVERSKLCNDYFGYDKTKLAHPMPDIVFFKDRKNPPKNKEEIVIDESGVAIKVGVAQNDTDVKPSERQKPNTKAKHEKSAVQTSEGEYEDKWDD